MEKTSKIPILMYHEVIEDNCNNQNLLKLMQSSYFVKKSNFQEQMFLIKEQGIKPISLYDVIDKLNRYATHKGSSEKCIAITFDDGYAGNYKHAFPILKKYGFTATFFVTVGQIGKPLMMNWQELEEMLKKGMSIQSHTISHPFLRQVSNNELTRQLRESKRVLEEKLNTRIDFLSLPHGSYGKNYKKTAMELGYKGGCCSISGLNTNMVNRYFLRRIHVSGIYNIHEFRKIIEKDRGFLAMLTVKKDLKIIFKKLIGESLYNKLYKIVFGIR